MIIPPIYHWSPRSRRLGIERSGLMPGKSPTVSTVSAIHDGVHVICFSSDPRRAWSLSGNAHWAREIDDTWDLWQTTIVDSDAVYLRAEYGPEIIEVRIANRIPKSRLWWVGERKS